MGLRMKDEEVEAMFSSAVANTDALRLLIVDLWERWRAGELSEDESQLATEFLGGRRLLRVTTMVVVDDVDSQPEINSLLGARVMSIFSRVEDLVAGGEPYTAALVQTCTDEVVG